MLEADLETRGSLHLSGRLCLLSHPKRPSAHVELEVGIIVNIRSGSCVESLVHVVLLGVLFSRSEKCKAFLAHRSVVSICGYFLNFFWGTGFDRNDHIGTIRKAMALIF